jgi:hypothetical protein
LQISAGLASLASPQPASPTFSTTNDIESSDDDEDYFPNDEMTPGWEPPAAQVSGTESDLSSDTDTDPPPPSTPPEDLRQRTWVRPKIVEFPNSRAGEPIGSASPSNDTYATSLENLSPSNPYSPFSSKIDWEVAQWAKLHGPSSTSFAELLKIDGVRCHDEIY